MSALVTEEMKAAAERVLAERDMFLATTDDAVAIYLAMRALERQDTAIRSAIAAMEPFAFEAGEWECMPDTELVVVTRAVAESHGVLVGDDARLLRISDFSAVRAALSSLRALAGEK
jgi:hypothetical protein